MKNRGVLFSVGVAMMVLLLAGCSFVPGIGVGGRTVTPSNVIITETRDVSGFSAIDLRSFGVVNLTQGDTESVTVSGSDNLVPLITTTVSNGTLVINTETKINILGGIRTDMLTFDIVVKDLNAITISGLADVTMPSVTASSLTITMSGAGNVQVDQIAADSVDVSVSGLGGVTLSGQATGAKAELSGAGNFDAGDLQCQTVDVTISGLGGATVWATEQLTGEISGAGSVRYYGNPQTNTQSSGAGSFQSLGAK